MRNIDSAPSQGYGGGMMPSSELSEADKARLKREEYKRELDAQMKQNQLGAPPKVVNEAVRTPGAD